VSLTNSCEKVNSESVEKMRLGSPFHLWGAAATKAWLPTVVLNSYECWFFKPGAPLRPLQIFFDWLKNIAAPFLILGGHCSSFFTCHPATVLARGASIMGMALPPSVIIWWIKKGWDPVGDFPQLEYCSVLWKCWTVGWAMRRASNLSTYCIKASVSGDLRLLQKRRAG